MLRAMTVRLILREISELLASHKIESPRLTAELLVSHVLGGKRLDLLADTNAPMTPPQIKRAREMASRRAKGEPLQYILGVVDFCGCEIAVDPRVLVPRPETELLVETASTKLRGCLNTVTLSAAKGLRPDRHKEILRSAQNDKMSWNMLDLCTGSGCIAIALAKQFPDAQILATDISQGALELASANAQRNGVGDRINFLCGDIFEPLPREAKFHVIVSNPPYIAESAFASLQREIREFEPRVALVAGESGLEALEKIIRQARDFLVSSGVLALEIGFDQREQVKQFLDRFSYKEIEFVRDLQGHSRVAVARLN
jgi:release factor glutamine methyltransferase